MAAEDHLRDWLERRMTGCRFAALLAKKAHLIWAAIDDLVQPEGLDDLFDGAAAEGKPVIVFWPWIRTESQLAEQLLLLDVGERWSLVRVQPAGLVTDDCLIGIEWRSGTGLRAMPMGLGPFGTMPVTRRAPYVCLAAWTGEHQNPNRRRYEPGIIDLLDTDVEAAGILPDAYKGLWDSSRAEATAILSDPPDSPSHYRTAAFRLSSGVEPVLGHVLRPESGA